ncbi:MAG TPA: MFS transporter [Armatimonadetes bacterium]|nr:MFS transporter [Armatimonadota bacterium]
MNGRASGGERKGITRYPNVLPLSLAALFNDTGADMLFAFYPLFFLMVLKEPRLRWFGLVETVTLLIGHIIKPFTGKLGDVRGRKPLICLGYLFLSISRFLQGLARVWPHLIPAKAVYEIGRGMRNPPRASLLASSVPPGRRGEAFGLLQSMDTVGAIIGPLLGMGVFSLLAWLGVGVEARFRIIFFVAAVPTLASILVVALLAREVGEGASPESEPGEEIETLREAENRRAFYILTSACSLVGLLAITETMLLACGASILGIKPEETLKMVFLYWLINISFAPSAILSGRVSDRVGRKPIVILGFLVLSALTALLPLAKRMFSLALIFLAHGVYQGLYKPVREAFVSDLAPRGLRGKWLGAFEMWTGVAGIVAPFLFGLLWDLLGPFGACYISAGAALTGAILISAFVREAR